ncbi:hypothetical protein BMF89_07690 [Arthrobacter sp. SRS-W-1-2016]|nr:hypothetical protein BMF89_07690 [Arthrobacter sp. SRS-W-1-2016]
MEPAPYTKNSLSEGWQTMNSAEQSEIERQCRELVLAISHLSDNNDGVNSASLFAEGATWFRAGKIYTGYDEILASYDDFSPSLVARHLIGTPLVTVLDSDHATSVTYYSAFVVDPGTTEPLFPLPFDGPFTMGEWHDKFVRTERGWLFSHRATHRMFQHGEHP